MNHHQRVREFYERVWNRGERPAIAELCHPGLTFRGSVGTTRHGHAGLASYVEEVTGALGDYRCDIEDLVVEGDRAFARMRFSGVHRGEFLGYPPTRRRVAWAGAALFRFSGERIVELWVLGDRHTLEAQLAAAPRTR